MIVAVVAAIVIGGWHAQRRPVPVPMDAGTDPGASVDDHGPVAGQDASVDSDIRYGPAGSRADMAGAPLLPSDTRAEAILRLDRAFSQEPVNIDMAASARKHIVELLATVMDNPSNGVMPADLDSLECRSDTCRLVLNTSNQQDAEGVAYALIPAIGSKLGRSVFVTRPGKDGTDVVIYAGTEHSSVIASAADRRNTGALTGP